MAGELGVETRGLTKKFGGRLPDVLVDAVLKTAGLTARAGDRFSGYSSMGMRQRLAVAAALLKDPELLVLVEPSNGLDPAGQLEMRRLIRDLAGQNRTILLSSHDMAEVEELCGRVAVIGGGTLLAEGSPGQLRGHRSLLQVFLELTGGRSGGSDSLRPPARCRPRRRPRAPDQAR